MPIRIISSKVPGPQSAQTTTPPPGTFDKPSAADKDTKPQPTRKLPTDRIAFQKQLDILRAYGLGSQSGTRAVSPREVADVVKMSATTVPLMNTFIVDNGFVEKSGTDFIPNRGLVEFAQAYNWMPETAARKMAPLIRRTWFGERMLTRLGFRGMTVDEVVADLGAQVGAGPEFKAQIELLVEYAVAASLVRRDGNQLSLGEEANTQNTESAVPKPEKVPTSPAPEVRDVREEATMSRPGAISTGFMNTDGAVQFHVNIKVSMQEIGGWPPDRIAAFFAGLAKVIAAKNGSETV